MLSYILRRGAYSVLIIIGVMALTFVMFRVAAGDPAAAMLGKNPTPEMVERLRAELGSDKPLFWGKWRRTETFTSIDARDARRLPGITFPASASFADGALTLSRDSLAFKRNFDSGAETLMAEITYSGKMTVNGRDFHSPSLTRQRLEFPASQDSLTINTTDNLTIREINFFRPQTSVLDSQFIDSMSELLAFRRDFPYVSVLNFGRSATTGEPAGRIIARGIWPSLMIMTPIFIGELLLGLALALIAAAFKDKWPDRTIVVLSVAGMSISYLVFIIFGQWYLGYYYNLFPVWGYATAWHLALPVGIGIASGLGGGVRFYRTVFVNELGKDYLKAARARGCTELAVYGKHLLRNAAIPVITRASNVLPFLFTGSLLLETFFGIPGLGYAGINALSNSDLQMIKALVVVSSMIFVAVNLLADIAYAWADPRVRLK